MILKNNLLVGFLLFLCVHIPIYPSVLCAASMNGRLNDRCRCEQNDSDSESEVNVKFICIAPLTFNNENPFAISDQEP